MLTYNGCVQPLIAAVQAAATPLASQALVRLPFTPSRSIGLRLSDGVVTHVSTQSQAHDHGVKPGWIVVHIDDEDVCGAAACERIAALQTLQDESVFSITFAALEEPTTAVPAASWCSSPAEPAVPEWTVQRHLEDAGASISSIPAEEGAVRVVFSASAIGMRLDQATGRVVSIRPGSQAAELGVQLGWAVLEVDDEPVGMPEIHGRVSALIGAARGFSLLFRVESERTRELRVEFSNGPVGLLLHPESSEVLKVEAGGQAEAHGIQVGWIVLKVDEDEDFSTPAFDKIAKACAANRGFSVTFYVRDGLGPNHAAVPSAAQAGSEPLGGLAMPCPSMSVSQTELDVTAVSIKQPTEGMQHGAPREGAARPGDVSQSRPPAIRAPTHATSELYSSDYLHCDDGSYPPMPIARGRFGSVVNITATVNPRIAFGFVLRDDSTRPAAAVRSAWWPALAGCASKPGVGGDRTRERIRSPWEHCAH